MLSIRNIEWIGDARTGHLRLLDQTRLPGEVAYVECRDVPAVWDAIKRLVVRGAPAIGIAAAYGCVLGVRASGDPAAGLRAAADHLATSRPTAVNLFWALDRMRAVCPCTPDALLAEARAIHEEDAAMCRRIGEHTLTLFDRAAASSVENGLISGVATREAPKDRSLTVAARSSGTIPGILTHCNAGALATGGIGTATAGMYLAHARGQRFPVFADETRPLLQGARLTAFELAAAGIDVTLLCDSMAAQVMREGRVALVLTGADRIAANGDAANKIGTYALAVLARHHGLPFYVAAPTSTFDLALADGRGIPIEERAAEEITEGFGRRTAPAGVRAYSPAFDVTPHELITAIVTERGILEPVNADSVRATLGA